MKTDKSWLEIAFHIAPTIAVLVAMIAWLVSGSNASSNTAAALAEFKTEFKVGMKEMSVKLEGLPTIVERTMQNEAKLKEAQTYIGMLDTRQSASERQAAATVVEIANLKARTR